MKFVLIATMCAGAFVLSASCKKGPPQVCAPSSTEACACAVGQGIRICAADGSAFGVCFCPPASSSAQVSSSSAGGNGAGGHAGGAGGQGGAAQGCAEPDCTSCTNSACAKSACAAQISACNANPECAAFGACLTMCGADPNCPLNCQQAHQSGVMAYSAQEGCLLCGAKTCRTQCDNNHMCQ